MNASIYANKPFWIIADILRMIWRELYDSYWQYRVDCTLAINLPTALPPALGKELKEKYRRITEFGEMLFLAMNSESLISIPGAEKPACRPIEFMKWFRKAPNLEIAIGFKPEFLYEVFLLLEPGEELSKPKTVKRGKQKKKKSSKKPVQKKDLGGNPFLDSKGEILAKIRQLRKEGVELKGIYWNHSLTSLTQRMKGKPRPHEKVPRRVKGKEYTRIVGCSIDTLKRIIKRENIK